MLPVKKTSRRGLRAFLLARGLLAFLLFSSACVAVDAEDFCLYTGLLTFSEDASPVQELSNNGVTVTYVDTFPIDLPSMFANVIQDSNKEPRLFLKSIRLVSNSITHYTFQHIGMELLPNPGASVPKVTVIDYDVPDKLSESTLIEPKRVNVVDYFSEDGTFDMKLSLKTYFTLHAPQLGIEICLDGGLTLSPPNWALKFAQTADSPSLSSDGFSPTTPLPQ